MRLGRIAVVGCARRDRPRSSSASSRPRDRIRSRSIAFVEGRSGQLRRPRQASRTKARAHLRSAGRRLSAPTRPLLCPMSQRRTRRRHSPPLKKQGKGAGNWQSDRPEPGASTRRSSTSSSPAVSSTPRRAASPRSRSAAARRTTASARCTSARPVAACGSPKARPTTTARSMAVQVRRVRPERDRLAARRSRAIRRATRCMRRPASRMPPPTPRPASASTSRPTAAIAGRSFRAATSSSSARSAQMALDSAGNLLVPIGSGVRGVSSVSGGALVERRRRRIRSPPAGCGARPGATFTLLWPSPAPVRGVDDGRGRPDARRTSSTSTPSSRASGVRLDNGATFSQIFARAGPTRRDGHRRSTAASSPSRRSRAARPACTSAKVRAAAPGHLLEFLAQRQRRHGGGVHAIRRRAGGRLLHDAVLVRQRTSYTPPGNPERRLSRRLVRLQHSSAASIERPRRAALDRRRRHVERPDAATATQRTPSSCIRTSTRS